MASDVSITFDGELSGIKSKLDELTHFAQAGFAAWGAEKVFDLLKEGLTKVIELAQEFAAVAQHAAQVDAQLNAALVSTSQAAGLSADELSRMAEDLERVTTFGHEAIKTAETLILRFQNIKGDQFKETTKLAVDMAARMGGDVAAAANDLGRALNNPLRGMMLLEREGQGLTESQKEVVQALVASGQTAAAQNILLTALAKQYSGAAEAAAQASGGGFKQLKNSIEDIKEEIGAKLLPTLDGLAPAFKFELEEIAKAVEGLIDELSALTDGIANSFSTTPAEKFVGAIAAIKAEMVELEKKALTVGLALDSALHPTHASDNIASVMFLDLSQQLASAFSGGKSPVEAAVQSEIGKFREAIKIDQEKSETRAKERAAVTNRTAESQADPNLIAFGKAFPGLTATADGLAKFGEELKKGAGEALGDAGKVIGAVAKPFEKTIQGIGGAVENIFKAKDDGFQSRLETAQEMFNRIQVAAASRPKEDKALAAAEATATNTQGLATKVGSVATALFQIKEALAGKGFVPVLG